jgi:hypothetical protein
MEPLPRSNAQTVSFEAGSGCLFRTSSFISIFPDGSLSGDATPACQQRQAFEISGTALICGARHLCRFNVACNLCDEAG